MEYKQAILIRQDLNLPKGKMAAQAAHAAVQAVLNGEKPQIKEWRDTGMKKIVLKVADENELIRFLQNAKDAGLTTALITDAGRTIVEPGTRTCIAIGPNDEKDIDRLTANLKLM